jgi:hypothetical protein
VICGDTHIDTQTDAERFMKYAAEVGSGVMIPSFMKNGSGIQKLIRGDMQTRRLMQSDL